MIKTGLARLSQGEAHAFLKGRRLGLLTHQAAVLPDFTPAHVVLKELFPRELRLLFAPQHGLFGEAQANMIPSADFVEDETGLGVVSLYGPRLAPGAEHLREIDVLVVDLQDVGCRVYTYIWTLFLALKACEKEGVEVLVLDRPNPIGGRREGPLLEEEFRSFVGLAPLPLRHGLTIGEVALYFRAFLGLSIPVHVLPLEGWRRSMLFPETGLPWVPPSPNMPSFDTALVYPGQVLLEGTNVSEGRGTTRPFEVFGAPWLVEEKVLADLADLPGVSWRRIQFVPWYDKWAGKTCRGLRLFVLDESGYRSVWTTLLLLDTMARNFAAFSWRLPPYEYQWHKLPFDIIVGTKNIREILGRGERTLLKEILETGLAEFEEEIRPFFLYQDAEE